MTFYSHHNLLKQFFFTSCFAAWYVFPFHPHCECVYVTSVPVRSSIHIWFWAKVTNWPIEWATSTGTPSRTNTSELLPLMWVPSNNKKKISHIDQFLGGVLIGLTLKKKSSWGSPQWKLRSSDLCCTACFCYNEQVKNWQIGCCQSMCLLDIRKHRFIVLLCLKLTFKTHNVSVRLKCHHIKTV